jgi:hypothetical protein
MVETKIRSSNNELGNELIQQVAKLAAENSALSKRMTSQENLQSKNSGGPIFKFADQIMSNSKDLRSLFYMVEGDIPMSPFCDIFTCFARMESAASNSSTDELKRRDYGKKDDLTEDDLMVTQSAKHRVPAIFESKAKPPMSEFSKIPNRKSWKSDDHGQYTGMGQTIKKLSIIVREQVQLSIDENFPQVLTGLSVRDIAQEMLNDTLTFVECLCGWIDETYDSLVSNSTPDQAAWYIVTKVIRAIFQDFMGPKRLGHIFGACLKERAAKYIWYSIQTHMLCNEVTKKEIKNHSVVHGVYSEWIISNSGLKEANEAKASSKKGLTEVDELKKQVQTLTSKLNTTNTELVKVKAQADRAAAAAKAK